MRCHLIASCLLITAVGWSNDSGLTHGRGEVGHFTQKLAPKYSREDFCVPEARPGRLSARYTEARGIGYNHGYTTLEGFFSPIGTLRSSWMPFVEARGHLLNNAFSAGNGGAGVRHLGKYVFGGSAYYDFRRTRHHWYNQVGVGFETLGDFWGVHLNGYIPVGKKKSHFYGKMSTTTFVFAPTFTSVTTHARKRVEFDFYGVDAHAEFSLGSYKASSFETGFGPYFFWGKYDKKFVGGRASITQKLRDWFSFSVSASYDSLFHTRVQGHLAVNIPLGPRTHDHPGILSCPYSPYLNRTLNFGQERFEIIPVTQTTLRATQRFLLPPLPIPPVPIPPIPPFTPASLAGLWLWLDAQDPLNNGTLPPDASTLTTWFDKSGNVNNFSDGVPPSFSTSITINGHPAVFFNGLTQYLTGPTNTTLVTYTFFGVFRTFPQSTGPTFNQFFYGNGNPNINGEAFGSLISGGNFFRADIYGGVADLLDGSLNTIPTLTEIWSSTWDGAHTTFFVDNVQQALTNSTLAPSAPSGTSIVGTNGSHTFFIDGSIGEIIFYSRNLSTTEQQQVYNYLAPKWGF